MSIIAYRIEIISAVLLAIELCDPIKAALAAVTGGLMP